MQAYYLGKVIEDEQVVIVGTGLPLVGACLAKKYLTPNCSLIVEAGLTDCNPIDIPRSVSDIRFMDHCSVQWPPYRYLGFQSNEWLHKSNRLIAFIGGAEIDPYGNVGSTCVGNYFKPKLRLPGSGGANGISTFCNTVIAMQHQKRRFIEKVEYITSPGWIDGPDGRSERGLPADRGPRMVVSERGVMKFDEETKRMYLYGYFPMSSPEDILENTGFVMDVSRAIPLEEPPANLVRILRIDVDPERIFLDL
jgi:glutaconate CoA-transferase subunit B